MRSTSPRGTPRLAAIVGNAGRYMSMAKGPIAVSAPMRMSQPGRPREVCVGDMKVYGEQRSRDMRARLPTVACLAPSGQMYHAWPYRKLVRVFRFIGSRSVRGTYPAAATSALAQSGVARMSSGVIGNVSRPWSIPSTRRGSGTAVPTATSTLLS